jgi:putative aldouronate transport system permease protein
MKESSVSPKINKKSLRQYLVANWELYLFLLPGLVVMFLFKVMPIQKISIAFKQFKPLIGLAKSQWVGLKHFKTLFSDPHVFVVIRNTLTINFLQLLFVTPSAMFLAILISELVNTTLKRWVQTIVYIPHFFTWVVVYSVFYILFGSTGIINDLIRNVGGDTILFFMRPNWFRFLVVISEMWHSVGWGTIVYLAAILAIDPQLYEAAIIDGANKWTQIYRITLPNLMPTFVLMVSIRLGNIMSSGFGQMLVFYNPTVYRVGDIISTYVYRMGLGQANFSYAAAVGLMNSVVGLICVMAANKLSKRVTGRSVW